MELIKSLSFIVIFLKKTLNKYRKLEKDINKLFMSMWRSNIIKLDVCKKCKKFIKENDVYF